MQIIKEQTLRFGVAALAPKMTCAMALATDWSFGVKRGEGI